MIIIDVRESEEFKKEYIPGSISCPLSQFNILAPGILRNIPSGSEVHFICRSGNRSRLAITELSRMNINHLVLKNLDGGILRWRDEGKEITGNKSIIPIMRQVQIVASTLILMAFALSYFVSPSWVYLALLPGLGLALSGWTGICPVVFLLQKMPWNSSTKINSAKASCCQ